MHEFIVGPTCEEPESNCGYDLSHWYLENSVPFPLILRSCGVILFGKNGYPHFFPKVLRKVLLPEI